HEGRHIIRRTKTSNADVVAFFARLSAAARDGDTRHHPLKGTCEVCYRPVYDILSAYLGNGPAEIYLFLCSISHDDHLVKAGLLLRQHYINNCSAIYGHLKHLISNQAELKNRARFRGYFIVSVLIRRSGRSRSFHSNVHIWSRIPIFEMDRSADPSILSQCKICCDEHKGQQDNAFMEIR